MPTLHRFNAQMTQAWVVARLYSGQLPLHLRHSGSVPDLQCCDVRVVLLGGGCRGPLRGSLQLCHFARVRFLGALHGLLVLGTPCSGLCLACAVRLCQVCVVLLLQRSHRGCSLRLQCLQRRRMLLLRSGELALVASCI